LNARLASKSADLRPHTSGSLRLRRIEYSHGHSAQAFKCGGASCTSECSDMDCLILPMDVIARWVNSKLVPSLGIACNLSISLAG
jgi:hypothetical protein